MIELAADETDDVVFLDLARRAMLGAALLTHSSVVHVVKIDSWFGDRWYSFAGKLEGAVGVRAADLRVPPFHPHRVRRESRFCLTGPAAEVPVTRPLHVARRSATNLNNSVRRLGESLTLGWYSGETAPSGRGAVMVYSSTARGTVGWYAGFERRREWEVVKRVGADEQLWAALLERGSGG